MDTIQVELKKKTIQSAYNQVMMLKSLDFQQHQKGEPLHDLIMEIKRSIKRQRKQDKLGWRELLEFWPLSIVIPSMLLLILLGSGGIFD
tara:strand:- start:2667 stop:2933 length:267 start_codon:yes stop_codon:yes gene_type:complete